MKRIVEYDIKSSMPTASEALSDLASIIRANRRKEKVIKIVHGYGSSGRGGKIKTQVHKTLRNKLANKEIRAYIPGEAIGSLMGFDEVIRTYKHLIKDDSDYRKTNDGITYIIF